MLIASHVPNRGKISTFEIAYLQHWCEDLFYVIHTLGAE